jgi:putative transposase
MGQSLVKNYVHIVFSTKFREPIIDIEIETELHHYIAGICNNLNCQLITIGGISDHIHILCILSKNISISQLVMEIKSNSSKWIKTKGVKYENFYWQNGYGAFSIGYERIDKVSAYILNQHIHHSKVKFQTEMRTTFKKNKVDFDERYVWD